MGGLTKAAHWAAASEEVLTAEQFVEIFDSYYRLHGVPEDIVSDQDPRFTGGHLAKSHRLVADKSADADGIPSADGWASGEGQLHRGTLSLTIRSR